MQIKKQDAKENANSETCMAYEYPFEDKDINIAFIEIEGRYPEQGFVINEKVKEIVYVLDGSGIMGVDDEIMELSEGDAVLFKPGQRVFYEGSLRLLTTCSPAWKPEQHKQV
jgi:mannose-6-phosphate isomerase-like protein (cupin superfamily)